MIGNLKQYININNFKDIKNKYIYNLFFNCSNYYKFIFKKNYTISFLYNVKILYYNSYYINTIDICNILERINY
ncbi:hypothetical protein PFTANZ_05896 [Plasmodium falciparum Tanzania (2000708)]|uniref:Uncharacterized protein n=1 Tax=Plasmodium falciparum Tanzania (2000708) TaxID=1036725 RepID=A0A024VYT4_PLAFA|nr:hypothetical protein PFTANZ_05896 [Plasmodium falciparum Tanzania (2000708)]